MGLLRHYVPRNDNFLLPVNYNKRLSHKTIGCFRYQDIKTKVQRGDKLNGSTLLSKISGCDRRFRKV
jgi:hypothetical protein